MKKRASNINLSRILKSQFISGVGILTSGTIAAQAVSLCTAPVLMRIYNPDAYGILGLFMTLSAFFIIIATVQLHNAIIVTEKNEDANIVTILVLAFNLIVSLISFVVVFLFQKEIYFLLGNNSIGNWLYLLPISVFFSGLNLILSTLAIRYKQFRLLSVNRFITSLVFSLVSIAMGIIYAGPMGLFVGLFVSQIIPTSFLWVYFVRSKMIIWSYDKEKMMHLLYRYKNFPLFSFPAGFLNSLSNELPVIMLSHISGIAAVGFFNLTNRVLALPIQLLSSSVSDVFKQRASVDYSNLGSCRTIFMKVFKTLSIMSAVPFVILILFGPELFSFFFSDKWRESGVLAQILGMLFVFKFIISPLSYVTYIANKQWISLMIDILLLSVISVIFFISYSFHLPYKMSLLMYAISYSVLYLLTFAISYHFTNKVGYAYKN